MKLADWLETNQVTAHAFAQRIGRAPSTVTRLIRGRHTPDAATMKSIIEVTDGAVLPNDFFDVPTGGTPTQPDEAAA